MVRVCYSLIILIQTLLGGALFIQDASHKIPHQDNLALQQLLTRTKEAAGGSQWDRIRTVSIKWQALEGGLTGVVHETDDLAGVRYVDAWDFGVRSGAYGFNGKIVWSQDSSGLAQTEEGSGAREGTINEAFRRSLAYWYPERWRAQVEYEGQKQDGALRFHVVKIVPDGGRPFELWFDGTTYLLARIVEKTATGILRVWLEDYREIDNLKVPFLVRVRLTTGSENVYRAEKVEFNVRLPDARFDIPPPPPPDFLLSGNVSSVTLPMDLINNHTYVSGKLNGQGPYRFLVDTGWGTSSITPEVARSLGLSQKGAQKTFGAGEGTAENSFTRVAKMQFGGVQLLNQSLLVTSAFDGKTRDAIGDFGGMLGYELFKRFVVSLDFERKTLTLTLPSRFAYRGEGTVVPFKLSNTIPLVQGEIDGIHGEFIVDNGFPGSVILYQNFVAKNDLATRLKPRFETITGWGIGGPVRAGVTRVRIFKVGEVTVPDSVVTLSLLKAGTLGDPYLAGAIGTEMLKRFNVTFDYSRRQMIFVRNANYGNREVFDRSGMYLNKGQGWFDVMDVVSGGPADEAGIRIGDRILSIDGKRSDRLSLPEVRLKFKGPVNSRINVITKRGNSTTHAVLVLRDLI